MKWTGKFEQRNSGKFESFRRYCTELFEWDIKQIRVQRQNAIGNLGSTE